MPARGGGLSSFIPPSARGQRTPRSPRLLQAALFPSTWTEVPPTVLFCPRDNGALVIESFPLSSCYPRGNAKRAGPHGRDHAAVSSVAIRSWFFCRSSPTGALTTGSALSHDAGLVHPQPLRGLAGPLARARPCSAIWSSRFPPRPGRSSEPVGFRGLGFRYCRSRSQQASKLSSELPLAMLTFFSFVLAVGRAILTFEASALRLFYRDSEGLIPSKSAQAFRHDLTAYGRELLLRYEKCSRGRRDGSTTRRAPGPQLSRVPTRSTASSVVEVAESVTSMTRG